MMVMMVVMMRLMMIWMMIAKMNDFRDHDVNDDMMMIVMMMVTMMRLMQLQFSATCHVPPTGTSQDAVQPIVTASVVHLLMFY